MSDLMFPIKTKPKFLIIPQAIVFFAAALFICQQGFPAEDAAVDAIQCRIKGYVYQQQGDFEKAIENYKKAIEFNPFYACAHNDLGVLYERKGLLEKAQAAYQKAIEIDPGYASAYGNLALLSESKGEYDAACYYWQRRIDLGDPRSPWTQNARQRYKELSHILAKQQKLKSAKQAYKVKSVKGIEVKSTLDEAVKFANDIAFKKALDKKLREKEAKKKDEDLRLCRAYVDKANGYMQKGSFDAAISQYQKAKQVMPDYPNIGILIKEAQDAQMDLEQQLKVQKQLEINAKKEAEARQERVREKQRLESQQQKAREEVEREQQRLRAQRKKEEENLKRREALTPAPKAEQEPSSGRLIKKEKRQKERLEKQEQEIGGGRRQKKARADQRQAKAEFQDQAKRKRIRQKIDGLLGKAEDYLSENKYSLAIKQYEKIRQLEPGYPNLDRLIENAQSGSSRFEAQQEEKLRRQKQDKDQQKKRKKEKPKEQKPKEQKPKEQKPKELKPKQVKQNFQQVKQKPEEIKKAEKRPFIETETTAVQQAGECVKRAKKYLNAGKYELAISEYESARRLNPKYPNIDELVKMAQEAAQRQQAKKKQGEISKEAKAYFNKGNNLYLNNKYEEAARQLELALSIDPQNQEAARLLRICQRHIEAYRPLQQSIHSTLQQTQQAAPAAVTGQAPPAAAVVAEGPAAVQKRIAQEVEKQEVSSPVLTAQEIDKKYETKGIVAYRSETNDISALNEELLKKAKELGAEEVIQMKYFQHNGFIYGYGTAVKKK